MHKKPQIHKSPKDGRKSPTQHLQSHVVDPSRQVIFNEVDKPLSSVCLTPISHKSSAPMFRPIQRKDPEVKHSEASKLKDELSPKRSRIVRKVIYLNPEASPDRESLPSFGHVTPQPKISLKQKLSTFFATQEEL